MATTSPDDIWTPDAGDDYALTTDLAAMADTIQAAITANKSDLSGLDADRPANGSPGLVVGMTWYSTDTGVTYRYSGTAWFLEHRPLTAWTPTVSGLTVGNGTLSAQYQQFRTVTEFFLTFVSGSTSAATGVVGFSLPNTVADASTYRHVGEGLLRYTGTNSGEWQVQPRLAGGSVINIAMFAADGSFTTPGNVSNSNPTSGAWSGSGLRPSIYVHGTYINA